MAIINTSGRLYGAADPASFDIALELAGDFAAEALAAFADDEFPGAIDLTGDFAAAAYTPGDDSFELPLQLAGEFEADTELVLVEPVPMTTTVGVNAFANQFYKVPPKLFINNVSVPYRKATISAPAGSLGKSLNIELAAASLAQLPPNATFRFEIYQWFAGSLHTYLILNGGRLEGRRFSMSRNRNALSFSTFETNSKLNKYPVNNLIVYDAAKAQVSADEIEPLYTNTNEVITTSARSVSVLTLYKLLQIAFVEGCGFSSFQTDIPNYEIARCDFSIVNSYQSAVAPFIGMYEPVFSVSGNTLKIQKTIDPLPPGYTPNALPASRYPNFSENLTNQSSNLDGYILNYTAVAGSFYVDRNLIPKTTNSGTFGEADFTETTVNRKVRDWFETGNPVAVRSDLKEEIRETRRDGALIGREIKTNTFDKLGRATGYSNAVYSRLPDVASDGVPSLLKVREETQKIAYRSNPLAPRQTIQNRIETASKALLAIDSDNTALDQYGEESPYPQDYERVFENGNLKKEMTSEFRTLSVTTEYFEPQANGQIEVRVETFDALRGKLRPSPPVETRSGDISVPNFTKQKTKTIFRPGVTQATRTGRPEPLNVGELPLFFAEGLALWLLENPRITGAIDVTGYDESIERGVSFNLRGSSGEDLGNFLIRGYEIEIEPEKIETHLDALKI